jgi:hypothetical protein
MAISSSTSWTSSSVENSWPLCGTCRLEDIRRVTDGFVGLSDGNAATGGDWEEGMRLELSARPSFGNVSKSVKSEGLIVPGDNA